MRPCPRCGLPFDSVHAAGQHAWKQQDEDHEDVESLDEGILLIADHGNPDGKPGDGGMDDSPSPDGADTVIDEGTETVADGGNPALDAPDPDPVVTDGGDPSDEPECPECGGNRYFDASDHTEYDYGCADCSDDESWVVFDE